MATMRWVADRELVERVLHRDAEAMRRFAERVACVRPFVRRRAQRMGARLGPAALDDIVGETYLALWRKLPGYRGESRLETWACGFAFHELRRWRERLARRSGIPLDAYGDPPEEWRIPDDSAQIVERALDHLGPPAEDVIRLKHFEDLTFEAISLRLDISTNTAKSHYYRGLARLRDWLGPRGEELAI
jgi:RNA polymerase sigma-70 factor (ECF subfamily)